MIQGALLVIVILLVLLFAKQAGQVRCNLQVPPGRVTHRI